MSPKIYRRRCDECGAQYEGFGAKFCSTECSQDAQRPDPEPSTLPDAPSDTIDIEIDGNTATINAAALPRILTLEELLDVCDVDMRVWEVERYKVNKWESAYKNDAGEADTIQLFQVKANLVRQPGAEMIPAIDAALDKMASHAPTYPKVTPIVRPKHERHLLELVLPDLHLGMLAWHRETGSDYDSQIASATYRTAIENLLRRSRTYGIERILLVVGNDFFHTDTMLDGMGATTAGTPQDMDGRRAKMIEMGCDLMVETVDKLLGVAPVKVMAVPGNHDAEESLSLARYLSAWYRNCEDVEVDYEPSPRKYHIYGATLLGFTHGKDEKLKELPNIMAVEEPGLWSESRFREWHLGHVHRKKEYAPVVVNEHQGVRLRHLSPLTGTDAWHHSRGYVGNVRAAEAFLWNYEHGLVDIKVWNVPTAEAA